MPRQNPNRTLAARHASSATPNASAALFRRWLLAGALLLAVLPVSSWYNPGIGWLPYWAIVAPALSLLLIHRQRVVAALFAFLVRAQRRRPPSARLRGKRPNRGARRTRLPASPRPLLIQR